MREGAVLKRRPAGLMTPQSTSCEGPAFSACGNHGQPLSPGSVQSSVEAVQSTGCAVPLARIFSTSRVACRSAREPMKNDTRRPATKS